MAAVYSTTSPPRYSNFALITPPTTPPPFEHPVHNNSSNPFRTSPRTEKMSFLGSFKDKLSKRSRNPFQQDTQEQAPKGSSSSSSNPFASDTKSSTVPSELPPAYSQQDPHSKFTKAHMTNDNDRYAFLTSFDTIFLIDDSGSMYGKNWAEVHQVLQSIVPICTQRDQDGIDLFFLNNRSPTSAPLGEASGGFYNITDPRTVNQIFSTVRPGGGTPLGTRLRDILMPYVARLSSAADPESIKPINIIVLTDGRASDDPESVIVQYAGMLDRLQRPLFQVGIQFFQVGNDRGASEALRELDDELPKLGVRDMVDTCSWADKDRGGKDLSADLILKAVLGGVVRRIDRLGPPKRST